MQIYALQGLGGIGKTQAALEYVYRYAREYQAIFWLEAETRESILASMGRIAECLQLPEHNEANLSRVVEAVQRWLVAQDSWLLIWDNVEELDLLRQFLPSAPQGAVLITTRCQTLGTLAQSIVLEPMTCEEGIFFTLQRAKISKGGFSREQLPQIVQRFPQEYAAAETLVTLMGGLPLALDQAGAYIEETGCSVSEYLQRYEQYLPQLLDWRGTSGRDHPSSVISTFSLAYEQIKRANPQAAEMLCLSACFSPENIPEELLTTPSLSSESTVAAVPADFAQRDQTFAALHAFSFFRRHLETRTFSIHRLVQMVLWEKMSEPERVTFQQQAVQRLHALFPEVTYEAWKQCERLLPHLLAVAETIPDEAGDAILAELLRKAAYYLYERAQYEQAERLYQRTLSILERLGGPECGDLARPLSNLATLYIRYARYDQAETFFLRALHIREQTLGPEHPTTARSLNNLAILYKEQGKSQQAEALYQHALRIWEQAFGLENVELAYLLNNLASLYKRQWKYEQAEPLYQRALHIREKALGPDHPLVAHPLYNLAELSTELGRYEQAEVLYERALHIWERALGQEHPDAVHSLCGLALLASKQGKDEQAETLYQRALHIWERTLGQEHPLTATALDGLATLYSRQGRETEAEDLYTRALAIWEQHPDVHLREMAQTLNGLANLYVQQQKNEQAEALYEQALRIQKQHHDQSHPERARSMVGLAGLCKKQGKDEQARALLQSASALFEQSLGPEHVETLQAKRGLEMT